jgi:predicted Zn-dependent peptidase
VFECQNLANLIGGNATVKSYTLVTNDDSLVSISLFGAKENFEKNLPIFEDAVKTIKLSSRGDISNSATFNAYKNALDSKTK